MNYFLKLNFSSILYAVLIFINIELIFNIYRISRIIELDVAVARNIGIVIMLISVIVFSFIYYLLNRRYLTDSKLNYYGTVLWIPYFAIMLILFNKLFPISNHGDQLNPIGRIVIYLGVLLYPIYLAIVIALSRKSKI
ncbi:MULTISPECIES: hypothetical protein [Priestia]|uniref:hypothetical protein n=1 Tax=Priestia TaxID=2800373 RepID=UPI0005ED028E|nr:MULTISPECIES: hypothetical protein [Priestia]KJL02401.1 hypothetical protein N178_23370 [Priestia aryabhattai B8W22]MBX4159947.1 hypothetical protein [Priestia megaterium]MED3895386.1 hypothetical protein [Priestia aryabhattai]